MRKSFYDDRYAPVARDAGIEGISISIHEALDGEFDHNLVGEHLIGLCPGHETTTTTATPGSKFCTIKWRPWSIGYVPPNFPLQAVMNTARKATYIWIPDRIFSHAAYETIDISKQETRWRVDVGDGAGAHLIHALEALQELGEISESKLLVESMCTALAVRSMMWSGLDPLKGDVPYPNGLSTERLKRVVDYIDGNLIKSLTLDEIAKIAALSPFHFSRAFRKSTGMTPVRYVWSRRVEKAKDYLKKDYAQLAPIAYACGFSSQSHFSTLFKRATGLTPAQYRAQHTTPKRKVVAGAMAAWASTIWLQWAPVISATAMAIE